jgi:hypothetical protein
VLALPHGAPHLRHGFSRVGGASAGLRIVRKDVFGVRGWCCCSQARARGSTVEHDSIIITLRAG